MHLMVDDEGESWQAGSPEFLKKLGDDHPDYDAVDYAVRNLGYIALRRHGESVRIICRAECVTPISLVGLLYLLVDLRPRRVALTLFSDTSDTWQTEIVGSVDDATARIEALSLKSRGGLTKEPLDFSAIDRSRRLRFHTLLGAWRQCGGAIETLPTALLQRADAADRSVTVKLVPDGRMAIVEYGPGFSLYGASWHENALGRTLDDQPDRRYGAWLQDDYRRAIDSFTPQFDYVDVTVAVTPDRKRRLVYERLVLPWRGKAGERLVSGFSVMRTTPSAS
jgi:hypothetical protein